MLNCTACNKRLKTCICRGGGQEIPKEFHTIEFNECSVDLEHGGIDQDCSVRIEALCQNCSTAIYKSVIKKIKKLQAQ